MTNDKSALSELVHEKIGEEDYEYLPLGKYIVAARGVCNGRPTVKYRRMDARHIIGYLQSGMSETWIAEQFELPIEAIREAVQLAKVYDYEHSYL
jgi:uncharacterized protein (DUF433 family)